MVNTLTDAIKNDRYIEVETLLQENSSLCVKRKSLFHIAAKHGSYNCLVLLLQKVPSEVTSRDPWGATPLHYAVRHGRVQCIDMLKNNTALESIDNQGITPVDLAYVNSIELKDTTSTSFIRAWKINMLRLKLPLMNFTFLGQSFESLCYFSPLVFAEFGQTVKAHPKTAWMTELFTSCSQKLFDHDRIEEELKEYSFSLIPSGWITHALSLVLFKKEGELFLAFGNQGEGSLRSGIAIYRVGSPFNLEIFIEKAAAAKRCQLSPEVENLFHEGMGTLLDLSEITFLPLKPQTRSDCSFHAPKLALHTLAWAKAYREGKTLRQCALIAKTTRKHFSQHDRILGIENLFRHPFMHTAESKSEEFKLNFQTFIQASLEANTKQESFCKTVRNLYPELA